MSAHAIDGDRLLADLRAALDDLRVGAWPQRASRYWKLRGLQVAYRTIVAGIEDGDYDPGRAEDPAYTMAEVDTEQIIAERWGKGGQT